MNQEWHVTVKGDPFQWRGWCTRVGIKPLWIELNNFERQLMCAITPKNLENDCCEIDAFFKDIGKQFEIVRIKHEVQPSRAEFLGIFTAADVKYYECHVKIDGVFEPDWPMSSRDLFRADRWYVTRRQEKEFDPVRFAHLVSSRLRSSARYVEYEYEACVQDTCPELDAYW